MNRLYVYRRKGRIGEWVAVGWFCLKCGKHTFEKKLKLNENICVTSKAA